MIRKLIIENIKNYYLESEGATDHQFSLPNYIKENLNLSNSAQGYFTNKHRKYLFNILKNKLEKTGLKLDTEKYYIAGGSVLSLLLYGNPFAIKDIDIFPQTIEDYNSIKNKLDELNRKNSESFVPISRIIYDNANAICYEFNGIKIDLIKKSYSSLKNCLEAFDLSCCKVGYDQSGGFYIVGKLGLIFDLSMRISDVKIHFSKENSIQIFKRVLKYSKKGFNLAGDDLLN